MSYSVNGNSGWSSVYGPGAGALQNNVETLSVVGVVTPTAAGDYPVLAANGLVVTLPAGAKVLSVNLQNNGTVLVGGTNVVVSRSAALTAGTNLTAVSLTADINNGVVVAADAAAGVASSTLLNLVATTVGVFTAGNVRVQVNYQL
jgi:hypothetical protein